MSYRTFEILGQIVNRLIGLRPLLYADGNTVLKCRTESQSALRDM